MVSPYSFVPSLDRNPLDSEFCKNLIELAKRIKSKPIAKKKPFSSQIIKDILDAYNKEDANLKDVRIAALCSLVFAGFFRYMAGGRRTLPKICTWRKVLITGFK